MNDDAVLVEVLDAYMSDVAAGKAPDRATLLAGHPHLRERLENCLASLEFIGRARPAGSEEKSDDPAPTELAGETLGDFRILREVGRGGMGVVYEAEQISLKRRVALKVLPFAAVFDQKHLQRFKTEAQAAAHLHHTHIVPVFAVGCERGVHYYAMQFIEGRALDTAIGELRDTPAAASDGASDALTPGTSTRSREFFRAVARIGVQAAEALHAAHEQGIVHRDVKPANLLLDARGKVWITDFGLAKLRDDPGLTMTGDLLGTIRYMSPEQALAKRVVVDERTDVYSLGVTLYELATQQAAFAGDDPQEVLRRIAFDEPCYPRRINDALPVELETIILKAIAKNPGERYHTAQELADDLRRHLEDKPIVARRPSLADRTRKWARRHRTIVGAAAVVMLLAVVGLAISNVFLARERGRTQDALEKAEKRRKEAETQRAEAQHQRDVVTAREKLVEKVVEFLTEDLLLAADPHTVGRNRTLREVLDAAATKLDGAFEDQPYVEYKLRRAIGEAYQGLTLYEEARPHLERALALCETHQQRLELRVGLAQLSREQGDAREAERLARGTLAHARLALGDEHETTLTAMCALGAALSDLGDWSGAQAILEETVAKSRRSLGGAHNLTLLALSSLVVVIDNRGDWVRAEAVSRERLRTLEKAKGDRHPYTLGAMNNLGDQLRRLGRESEARELLTRAYDLCTSELGPEHGLTTSVRGNLACLAEPADAVREFEACLALARRKLGDAHRLTLVHMANLAVTYHRVGRHEEAIALLEQTRKLRHRVLGPKHPDNIQDLAYQATLHSVLQEHAQADELFEKAVDLALEVLGPEHSRTIDLRLKWGSLLVKQARFGTAEPLLREVLAASEHHLWDNAWSATRSKTLLSRVLSAKGEHAEAERFAREALEYFRSKSEHHLTVQAMHDHGVTLFRWGKHAEAERIWRQAIEIGERRLKRDDGILLIIQEWLAELLLQVGRREEADALIEKALAGRVRSLGPEHPDTLCSRVNQAAHWVANGEFARCEKLLVELLPVVRRVLGKGHLETASVLLNLGQAYAGQRKHDKALEALAAAHGIVESSGAMDSDTACMVAFHMAGSLHGIGRYEAAERRYAEAIALATRVYGAHHRIALRGMWALASCIRDSGRLEESKALLTRTYELCCQTLGPDHERTVQAELSLHAAFVESGALADAETMARSRLEESRRRLDRDHPLLPVRCLKLADALLRRGRFAAAEPLAREALEIRAKRMPGTWLYFNALGHVGWALKGQGEYADAEPLLLKAHEGLWRSADAPAGRKRMPAEALVRLYEATDRPDDAARFRELLE